MYKILIFSKGVEPVEAEPIKQRPTAAVKIVVDL